MKRHRGQSLENLNPPGHLQVGVCADPPEDEALRRAAARLAVDLNLALIERPVGAEESLDALVGVTAKRLELRMLRGPAAVRGGRAVCVELEKLTRGLRVGRVLRTALFRALGIRSQRDLPRTVIDATAGWGQDAWLMAWAGCQVLAVERNRIVATLLRDGLLRAGLYEPEVAGRLKLICTDSRHLLRRLARRRNQSEAEEGLPETVAGFLEPEVVYLDPMFPELRKTASRKALQVLRLLVGDDPDAPELLEWALAAAQRRVVVKRSSRAPELTVPGRRPDIRYEGRAVRYDVYLVRG